MLVLANENIPMSVVMALRQDGHDVAWVIETTPGAADEDVLQAAIDQQRLLLTLDKDFGELVFRSGRQAQGIVLVRPPYGQPEQLAGRFFADPSRLIGAFCVVEGDVQRCRPLP